MLSNGKQWGAAAVLLAMFALTVLSIRPSHAEQVLALGSGASANTRLDFRIRIPAKLMVSAGVDDRWLVQANAGPLVLIGGGAPAVQPGISHSLPLDGNWTLVSP